MSSKNRFKNKIKSLIPTVQAIKDFLFGLTTFEMYKETKKIAKAYENLIYMLMIGEFLGIPFFSNYYTLRLLPYFLHGLYDFRSNVVRERDIFEEIAEYDVH
jgi:hypothetical protein